MFKFLHAADIHLDSPLRGLDRYQDCPSEDIRYATRRALENLVGLAIGEKVDFVVIGGDIYDGNWPDHGTGLFFAKQMAILRDASIPVCLISGNHDAANKMTRRLRLPDNVHVLDTSRPQTIHLDPWDVAVHGQSYATEMVTDDLAATYPEADPGCFNLGLLHTSVDGREGHGRYAPCTVETLRARGYQYWALGHVHTRGELGPRGAPIVFPGNLQGRHVREPGAKGCVVVRVESGIVASIEFHPLDLFRWETCRIDASRLRDVDEVLQEFQASLAGLVGSAEGRTLAMRVEVVGETSGHDAIASSIDQVEQEIRQLANAHLGGQVWVEKVIVKTRPRSLCSDLADAGGPFGEIDRVIAEFRDDPAVLLRFIKGELVDVLPKLPAELKNSDYGFDVDDASTMIEMLDQIRPLLDARFHALGTKTG